MAMVMASESPHGRTEATDKHLQHPARHTKRRSSPEHTMDLRCNPDCGSMPPVQPPMVDSELALARVARHGYPLERSLLCRVPRLRGARSQRDAKRSSVMLAVAERSTTSLPSALDGLGFWKKYFKNDFKHKGSKWLQA
mmetsp:Transcript_99113/g.266212  ORF Transcript_99113/g.266212 Transcript_99113/m.266212 type:complete len:139 (-) Transcript_99113:32-448(-)